MSSVTPHQRLSEVQRSRWEWLLRVIALADSQSLVARSVYRANGYLLGLSDAGVITDEDRAALYQEARAKEFEAATRFSGTPK